MVWRTSGSIRGKRSAGGRSPDRGGRAGAVYEAWNRRFLLDHFLPRDAGAGARDGDQRCPTHYDSDERCRAKSRRNSFGLSNAVSRVSSLLAVAVFGALMTGVFQNVLDRELDVLAVNPAVWAQVWAQRSKLVAAEVGEPRGREAVGEAFVAGYRTVLCVAAALALASSSSAAALISTERRSQRQKAP